MVKKQLTPKQQAFIDEYLVDFNASAAAVRAGYSPRAVPEIGCENLRKPHIIKKIVARRDELVKKARVDQERVLAEECCIAFSDIRGLFDESGELLPVEEIPEHLARAIAGIEVIKTTDKDGNSETLTKYRLLDKGRSLERLGRYLAMYKEPGDKVGQGLESLAKVMEQALERKTWNSGLNLNLSIK